MKKIISILSMLALCLIFAGCQEKGFGEGVTLKGIEVEEIFRIGVNQIGKAKAYPIPWNCTDYEFSWTTSDPSVATVNNYGTVTAVAQRDATCNLTVSGSSFSKTIQVQVIAKPQIELFEETNVKHLFLFEDASNLLKATIGTDLLRHPAALDPLQQVAGYNAESKAVRIPACRLDALAGVVSNGFILNHGFQANPAGQNRVNQYSILVDIKFSPRYNNYSLNADFEIVTSPLPNGPGPFLYDAGWSDGWNYGLFLSDVDPVTYQPNGHNMGFRWQSNGSYGVRDVVTAAQLFQRDTWYRFVICVDMSMSFTYFRNGVKDAHTATNLRALDDVDRTLPVNFISLFNHYGGNNNPPRPDQFEAQEVEIATLAFWDRCLTESEARGLILPDPDAFGVLLVP